MKGVLLAGGRGKRIDEYSQEKNKCMLKVFGKPLIEYSFECLCNVKEIGEVIVVVGYRAEDIINTYGASYKDKKIQYVTQTQQRGLVHAIECAKDKLERDDFMLMLADELMVNPHHSEFFESFKTDDVMGLCGVVEVEDRELIRKTYSLIQSEDRKIYRLIEKPDHPFNSIMGTGNCIFKNEIFSYIEKTPINQNRGEKELPDLIQCAIDDGHVVKSFPICQKYVNVNSKEELKEAKSYFSHF